MFFTSVKNKVPELSKHLFVRFWVPIKQTNHNHLLLAVDPVLKGWLCNLEAVGISNMSIKYGLIPKSKKIGRGLFMGRPGNVFVADDLLSL